MPLFDTQTGRAAAQRAVAKRPNLQFHERDRLIAWLEAHRAIDPDRGCWLWTGPTAGSLTYGVLCVSGRNIYAHRLSAHLFLDFDLSSPLRILHRCDTPLCFNPAHLFEGTAGDNIQDCLAKGRFNYTDRARGETQHSAKLTAADVRAIRAAAAAGEPLKSIARRYPVTPTQVGYIVRRKSWKHVE